MDKRNDHRRQSNQRPGGYTYRAGERGQPAADAPRTAPQQTRDGASLYDQERDPRSRGAAPKKTRRRARRALRRGIALAVLAVAVLGLAWVITRWIEGREMVPAGDGEEPAVVAPSEEEDLPGSLREPLASLPAVDNTSWNFIGPVEQEAEAMTLVAPSSEMIALPENGRVDMQYFDTVTFVGDSITLGLVQWNTIPNAKYCAYVGVSPKGLYDGSVQTKPDGTQEIPLDALRDSQPDNVYVLLGTNAMVNIADDEVLLTYYSEMLDAMEAALDPAVDFYVQSITPVLQGVDDRFDFDRIARLNDALAKMAWEKGMYYLDLHEALAGDDGWLRGDYGAPADGYHLQPAGTTAWLEYLVTHTAYNRRHVHLYLEGSNYYIQSPLPS